MRDRFNEELVTSAEYMTPQTGGHHRNLQQLRNQHERRSAQSQASRRSSDVFSSQAKRRSKAEPDQQSVITVERLKRFNDQRGTIAGTATDEL